MWLNKYYSRSTFILKNGEGDHLEKCFSLLVGGLRDQEKLNDRTTKWKPQRDPEYFAADILVLHSLFWWPRI